MEFEDLNKAFLNTEAFKPWNSAAFGVFVLSLRFPEEDAKTLMAETIVDGSEDGKTDVIYIDSSSGISVIIQAYKSDELEKSNAPANKADDLNTAINWIFNIEENKIPEKIRDSAISLRNSIRNNEIKQIEVWYVNNCLESAQIKARMEAVERNLKVAIENNFSEQFKSINLCAKEIGLNSVRELYTGGEPKIYVNSTIDFDVSDGYYVDGSDWHAFSTVVSAKKLYELYKKYGQDLFSANIREYMGRRKTDQDINNNILKTCTEEPENFWAYNNGITCLTSDYKVKTDIETKRPKNIIVNGIAIVNGAQTTGAIGSLTGEPNSKVFVNARFVKCEDTETIKNIIEYNNNQNKIYPADFRSGDIIQKRLAKEFSLRQDVFYDIRRSTKDRDSKFILKRDTVAQSLAAFQQRPHVAYHQKTRIWEDDEIYPFIFTEKTSASHIILAYSLLIAIGRKKELLMEKDQTALTTPEQAQLEFLRTRGAMILFESAIAASLETFTEKKVDLYIASFKKDITIDKAVKLWVPVVEIAMSYTQVLSPALVGGRIIEDPAPQIGTFTQLLDSMSKIEKSRDTWGIFKEFADNIVNF